MCFTLSLLQGKDTMNRLFNKNGGVIAPLFFGCHVKGIKIPTAATSPFIPISI